MSTKEGIVEEVISPLLKQLADAKLLADRSFQGDGNLSDIRLLLEKIHTAVNDVKVVFLRERRWERDVMDELGSVARHVDEILQGTGDCGSSHEFGLKLLRIDHHASRIRELVTPPLRLPPLESCGSQLPPSSPPTKGGIKKSPAEGDLWQLELERKILESSAMAELQVSYDALDLQLKLCLLCFSIYPEDSVIKRRALIYWWIGEGLVSPARGRTAEEVGDKCFNELISKRLIEPVRRRHTPVVGSCRMHPWIRRMLISVARRGEFFDFDQEGNPTPDFSRSRRACLHGASPPPMLMGRQTRADELSTLFNLDEPYLRFRKGWLTNLRKVAVLQLGRWQCSAKQHIEVEDTEFLEGLGSLKQLRYLSLQGISRITELPASIGGLTNLWILDLRSCHNLEKLAAGVASLKRLTHLDVSECYLLEDMPKGLGSLVQLQVLKGFVIGNPRSRDSCRLSELTSLQKLRKLSISIGGAAVVAGASREMNELQRLESLRSLTITWGLVSLPSRKGATRLTRAATISMDPSLLLPRNLEKLDLRCFPRVEPPQWLNPTALSGLKKLYVRGGRLGILPLNPAETWRKVEVLRLKFLSELKVEWSVLIAAFPSLVCVEIFKCDKINSCPNSDEDGVWTRASTGSQQPRRDAVIP